MTTPAAYPILRRAEYSLSHEQRALRGSFAALLGRECPIQRVRDAEPFGFDEKLWCRLVEANIVGMGIGEDVGGDGAGLVELALVAEQIGQRLAPVPFVESVVASRALVHCAPAGEHWLHRAVDGSAVVTLALHPAIPGQSQLVPAGALAHAVLALAGDQLLLMTRDDPPPPVGNHGCAPLGRWDLNDPATTVTPLSDRTAGAPALQRAVREWKLLMAGVQIGIGTGALELAVEVARHRSAFGQPIGTYQGISHPLVDSHIALVGARRLLWKAAWFADHEPDAQRHLVHMAFAHACRAAAQATTVGMHTLGGLGVTLEADQQLYFRRAKGWANIAGDPTTELASIADALYGPARG